MTNIGAKSKTQAKRKATGKTDWSKALMTVRKLKKSAESGHDDATVVVGENMVVIRRNSALKGAAHVHKVLESYGIRRRGTQQSHTEAIDREMNLLYGPIADAYKSYSEQARIGELIDKYKLYEQSNRDLAASHAVSQKIGDVEDIVKVYHYHVEKAKYKELINAYNQQVRQHVENYQADRERFVRTLKESPSAEALAFYKSIAPGGL